MDLLHTWVQAYRWRVLAGCAVFLAGYLLIADYGPRAASTYTVFGTWRQQRATIASVDGWAVRGAPVEARKRWLQQRLRDLHVRLPASNPLSSLVQVIQESAEAVQVDLREIRPAEPGTFAGYDALPFQIVLQGRFHKIGLFIDHIEQAPYVVRVQQLNLQRVAPSSEELRAEVLFSMIVLKEQEDAS